MRCAHSLPGHRSPPTLGVLGVDMDKARIEELLTPIPPELEAEVDQFRAALKAESDRGCALIVASYLDVS